MSEEMKAIQFRQARATDGDLAAATIMAGMLEDVTSEQYPRNVDGEWRAGEPEYFDEEEAAHVQEFFRRITLLIMRNPGMLGRVVHGMCVLCDPRNELIDPEKDYLAPHPSTLKPMYAIAELVGGLKLALDEVVNYLARDPGTEAARIKPLLDALVVRYEESGGPLFPKPAVQGRFDEVTRLAFQAVFASLDVKLGAELKGDVLHKGTVLATLMMLRDTLRTLDAELADSLEFKQAEAACSEGKTGKFALCVHFQNVGDDGVSWTENFDLDADGKLFEGTLEKAVATKLGMTMPTLSVEFTNETDGVICVGNDEDEIGEFFSKEVER